MQTLERLLTLITRALVLLSKKVCLLSQHFEILTSISLINESIPGMFVLFVCISHDDSKYVHEIPNCFFIFSFFVDILYRSTHACRTVSVLIPGRIKAQYHSQAGRASFERVEPGI